LHRTGSMRYRLYTEWSAVRKMLQYQPLDYVKEYFGVKIGLYFAWLGFYTHMLLPAAIVGLLCFVYSCLTLYSNQPRYVTYFRLISLQVGSPFLQVCRNIFISFSVKTSAMKNLTSKCAPSVIIFAPHGP